MRQITLKDVSPEVFTADECAGSEVWDSDLTLSRGGIYRIAATSGRGKTSLCAFVYGLRDDYRGTIFFDSQDIRRYSIDDWCRLRQTSLAFLPQSLDLFAELTAIDNILLKNKLTDYHTEVEIRQLLDRVGVAGRADAPAGRLSVGQQQRVALVRALCQPFDFLLLDEPVSHLDEENNRICASLISEEARRRGAAVIYTSVGNDLAIQGTIINLSL